MSTATLEPAPASTLLPARPRVQASLRVGAVDDPLEREADAVAERVLRMPDPAPALARPCRDSADSEVRRCPGGCPPEGCQNDVAHRQPASGGTPPGVSARAAAAIQSRRGVGQPLAVPERSFFEPRLGAGLDRVRVHIDADAASLSRELGARAFTVGDDVFFGAGEYAPATARGRRLLAHELVHVIQHLRPGAVDAAHERPADTMLRMPDPGPALAGARARGAAEPRRDVDDGDGDGTSATGTAGPSGSVTALPAGGSGGCCVTLSPPTACPTDPTGCADDAWVDVVMDCLRTVPQPPGVTFGTEILADARREVADGVTTTRRTWGALPQPRRTMPQFLGLLGDACRTRATELEVEYRFNVVFANVAGEPQWGTAPPWSGVVAALEAIPAEHLSQRPGRATPVVFRRRALSPRDLAAGTRRIGGEAIDARGEIEVYDPGVRTTPYGRSAAIGIAGTAQTLRHEVGHTVDALVPPTEREHFKENVVGWVDYARHWITQGRPSPTCDPSATGLARQGCQLCTELGFVTGGACEDARLDAFIAGLASGPQTRGGREYALGDHFLASVPVDRVPQIGEFEYARHNFGEYVAEIYAFAVSVPQWLHRVLPAAQVDWLKRRVFDTSRHVSEVSASLALGEPYASQFLAEARFVFTRRQLLTVVDQVLARTASERAGTRAA